MSERDWGRDDEAPHMQPVYCGFWRRVGAAIIDGFVVGIVSISLANVLGLPIPDLSAYAGNPEAMMRAIQALMPDIWKLQILSIGVNWMYFSLLESSSWQATFGKLAVGAYVTDLRGHRIGFPQATGRYFAKILSGMILLIGYLMVAFTAKKQGLHDILASTLVLRRA